MFVQPFALPGHAATTPVKCSTHRLSFIMKLVEVSLLYMYTSSVACIDGYGTGSRNAALFIGSHACGTVARRISRTKCKLGKEVR